MEKRVVGLLVFWLLVCLPGAPTQPIELKEAVGAVLDSFHRAASEADGALYFSLFSNDAVFIGTDLTERWSLDQLMAFAEPYFSKGQGWTYVPGERHVVILPGGGTAQFDEILSNESYGTCRGTGVLILTEEGWRISQYSLTIPIPNELARDVVLKIKELEACYLSKAVEYEDRGPSF